MIISFPISLAHNVYGHESVQVMRKASLAHEEDKRPLIISKSTFIGTGKS